MADRSYTKKKELQQQSAKKGYNSQAGSVQYERTNLPSESYATVPTKCIEIGFNNALYDDKENEAGHDMGGSDSSSGGAGEPEQDEQERLRRLFHLCDRDSDGLMDEQDLNSMCRLLGMEDSVEEITEQLGMGSKSGRQYISFSDFVQTRARLINESQETRIPIESSGTMFRVDGSTFKFREECTHSEADANEALRRTTSAVSSDNSLGPLGGGSLDYDSGARDVESLEYSVEMFSFNQPISLYTLLERQYPELLQDYLDVVSNIQRADSTTTDILQEANRLYMAAVSKIKSELDETSSRAQRAQTELHIMKKQISRLQTEMRVHECDTSEHAEQQMIRYEDRMTELQSVIAELRKKLDHRQITVIREEDEADENDSVLSNCSNDDRSVNDKSNDLESALDGCSKFSLPRSLNHSLGRTKGDLPLHSTQSVLRDSLQTLRLNDATPQNSVLCISTDNSVCVKQTSVSDTLDDGRLELKLEMLEQDNEHLLEQTGLQESELIRLRNELIGVREEKEQYKRKMFELQQTKTMTFETTVNFSPSTSQHVSTKHVSTGLSERSLVHQSQQQLPLAKVAELKRLKTGKQDRPVLGAEISSLGLASAKMAEHLAQGMHESSSLQEMLQLAQLGGAPGGGVNLAALNKIREFEIDLERLQSKADNLKSQNDVLTLTLQESKALCDRLTVLMGRYESNNTALQMSVAYSDQALEMYRILTALLDTEQALILARFSASGFNTLGTEPLDSTHILQKSLLARNDVEQIARQLLIKYDGNGAGPQYAERTSCAPWEELSSNSQTASYCDSTTSSTTSADDSEFNKLDERRLRDHVHALLTDRAAIKLTVMELESIYLDSVSSITSPDCEEEDSGGGLHPDALRLDLENAVLMQELMAMKEEKAELKAENYLLEKERVALDLELSGRESQTHTYLTQIEHLKTELTHCQITQLQLTQSYYSQKKDQFDVTCSSHATNLHGLGDTPVTTAPSSNVVDLLKRDVALRTRISELMTSLDMLSKSSEQRHQQSAMFVNELKRANSALVAAFEKTKKKYMSKTKKMEEQMAALIDRHETEVQVIQKKVTFLESELTRFQSRAV